MDGIRFGRGVRALRQRRKWRQSDVAVLAGVSRTVVARIEGGRGDRVTVRTLDRVVEALGARVVCRIDWNGEAIDRLLDHGHARLVEWLVAAFVAEGWIVATEVTFSIRGERGSIDVLAWHEASRSLLVVEAKTVVPDLQAMNVALDRKARLAREIASDRGWNPLSVSQLLAITATRTSRRRVAAHALTFGARLPDRNVAVKRWLRTPEASRPLAGLWFVSDVTQPDTRHRVRRQEPGP